MVAVVVLVYVVIKARLDDWPAPPFRVIESAIQDLAPL